MKTKKNLLSTICAGAVIVAAAAGGAEYPKPAAQSQATPAAGGTLEADYEDFARSGVFDPELPNAKALDMVSRGLFSGNPRLVRLTLEAMGGHALARRVGETVVGRNFGAVPQLKEFLIARWRALQEGGVIRGVEGMEDLEVVAALVKAAIENGGNMWAVVAASNPDLSLIPAVLASSFPGDGDVHQLLWEFRPLLQGAPQADGWMLSLFNDGRFKTPEVDRLRIASLESDEPLTFVEATKGLAMSRPEGGLEALISTLRATGDDIVWERALANAIVSYGPEAAIPLLDDEDIERIRRSSSIYMPW